MSVTAHVFDAHDECGAAVFREYLGALFTSGVFSDSLQVVPSGGMTVSVQPGYTHLLGAVRYFAESTAFTLDMASSGGDRVDTIVAECNMGERNITLKAVTGSIAASYPQPDPPVRSGGVYQIVLAHIVVRRGAVEVAGGDILDTRDNTAICGLVRGRDRSLDMSQLMAAFEAWQDKQFDDIVAEVDHWYSNVYVNIEPLSPSDIDKIAIATAENEAFVDNVRGTRFAEVSNGIQALMADADLLGANVTARNSRFFNVIAGEAVELSDKDYQATDVLLLRCTTLKVPNVSGARGICTFALKRSSTSTSGTFLAAVTACDADAAQISGTSYYNGNVRRLMCHVEITMSYNAATKRWGVSQIRGFGKYTTQHFGPASSSSSTGDISISESYYMADDSNWTPKSESNFVDWNINVGGMLAIRNVTALVSE